VCVRLDACQEEHFDISTFYFYTLHQQQCHPDETATVSMAPVPLEPLKGLQGLPYEACKVTMHSRLLCLRPRFWEQHYFAQVRAATALLCTTLAEQAQGHHVAATAAF
jgi:hypothetical protein